MMSEQITTTRTPWNQAMHWLMEYTPDIPSLHPLIVAALITSLAAIIIALIRFYGSDTWGKRRTNSLWAALRRACPHMKIEDVGGKQTVKSLCVRLNDGTPWLVCQLCFSKIDEYDERNIVERWSTMTLEDAHHEITKPRKKADLLKEKLDRHDYNWWRKP